MTLSFQKLFYVIASIIAIFAVLILAKTILIPLSFALLLAFILLPLAKKFEKWGLNRIFASSLSLLTVVLIVLCVTIFFSTQIITISEEFSNFQGRVISVFTDATLYINTNVQFIEDFSKEDVFEKIKSWLNNSAGSLAKKSISDTASFLTGLLAAFIFTFLILIYRRGLTIAMSSFFSKENREQVINMFKSVQKVGQQYFLGMLLLIIILGLGNTLGLWLIGIDNPLFFGYFGAILSIIPYIGTTFGALIPVLYALMAYDSPWMALSVALLFWAVQVITDNFLTPKIVGGSLKLNALATILSLIIGAAVWGVAGMILFLPFAAMLKVVCEEYEVLKPVALLIGNANYQKEEEDSAKFIGKHLKKIRSWFS